jgi:hypothetical protein
LQQRSFKPFLPADMQWAALQWNLSRGFSLHYWLYETFWVYLEENMMIPVSLRLKLTDIGQY